MARKREDVDGFKNLKISKEARNKLITKQFRSVSSLNWEKVFSADSVILGQIIGDIIKVNNSPSRPGKRISLEYEDTESNLKKFLGEDYTYERFGVALKELMNKNNMSIRKLSEKCGLDKMTIHPLIHNKTKPTFQQIEIISGVFDKDANYFVEYRAYLICGNIYNYLTDHPESSVMMYRKFK